MNKVFLLLRQNTQSGPFTFDELLQQKLRPSDLIWMDGKSDNWFNPDDLWQFLKNNPNLLAPQNNNGAGPTSSGTPAEMPPAKAANLTPEMELEMRAEEIRKRALEYAAHTQAPITRVEHTSSRSRTIHIADENIEFTHHRRSGATTVPQLLMASVVAFILVGIVYLGWSPINAKKHEVSGVAIPAGTSIVQEPQTEAVPAVALEETTSTANELIVDPVFAETTTPAPAPKKEILKKQRAETKPQTIAEVKETPPVKEEPIVTTAAVPAATPVAEPKAEVKKEPEVPVTTEATEKKKSLGQVLKGIFKKKNRGEDKEEDTEN